MDINLANEVIKRLSQEIGMNARTRIQQDIQWVYKNPEAWRFRQIPGLSSREFKTFRDFITHRTPWGLGWTIKTAEAMILPERPEIWQEIEAGIEPSKFFGSNQHTDKLSNEGVINHTLKRGSTSREYRLSVLKRDAPEVAERVIKGEISARQGMIMTGKMIPTSVVQRTVDGYFKCAKRDLSVHDRQELANMLIEDNLNFKK